MLLLELHEEWVLVLLEKITEQDDMEVVAAIEMPNTPLVGKDIGLQACIDELGVPITGSEDLEKALKEAKPDVLVDFYFCTCFCSDFSSCR